MDSEDIVNYAKTIGFDDVVASIEKRHTQQVKIAMNRVENVFDWNYFDTDIFLAYKKRTMTLGLDSPAEKKVTDALEKARKRIETMEPNEDYYGIADPSFRSDGDRIEDRELELLPEAHRALSLSRGLNCAGVVEGFITNRENATSSGAFFTDSNEFYRVCIRLYSDVETSGQSVECSKSLDIERCIKTAKEMAKRAEKPVHADPGSYEVLYTPLAFSNLIDEVLNFSSIYSVESGCPS